ncbi:MAG: hypothetical protein AMJ90_10015 [candidate division Zixibacteria bacterium SM23_73_2]|nr:MAG: hypothetical protein AMJ90_10015 [candidate division Zixibacteria bacterium SM23_73_2]
MIESYDFGEIIINGKKYTSDVIIYPDKVDSSWWRKTSHEILVEDIPEEIFKVNPKAIVVGKGFYGDMKVLPETVVYLKKKGIKLIEKNTKEACETLNELSQKEIVVGLFHLTC